MTLIDLVFTVEKTGDGIAIFLPTTELRIDRGGFAISLNPASDVSINQAHLYNKDPHGVVRHTEILANGEKRTDFYKRFGDYDFILFRPRLGDQHWRMYRPGEPEPVKEDDVLNPHLQGQLSFGPESLEYWAFRALLSVGVHHAEDEPFPKIVSSTNLQDIIE